MALIRFIDWALKIVFRRERCPECFHYSMKWYPSGAIMKDVNLFGFWKCSSCKYKINVTLGEALLKLGYVSDEKDGKD